MTKHLASDLLYSGYKTLRWWLDLKILEVFSNFNDSKMHWLFMLNLESSNLTT